MNSNMPHRQCLGLALACALWTLFTPASAQMPMVASFEAPAEVGNWLISGDCELSSEHATQGASSLQIRWPQGRGLIAGGLPQDWSGWETLRVDFYNPGPPFRFTLRADDETGATASSWYHHVRTGAGTLEFYVRGLAEKIDVSRIKTAHIRIDPPLSRPVTVFFDNIRFARDESPVVYDPPAGDYKPIVQEGANLIENADFENGLQAWGTWGEWDGGVYEFGTGIGDNAHSGAASAAVICTKLGRGGIFSMPVRLPASGEYKLSFWVKGSLGGRIRYGFEAGDRHFIKEGTAETQWQPISLNLNLPEGAEGRVYLYSLAPGTVYFDEVRLVPPTQPAADAEPAKEPAATEDPNNRVPNPGFEMGLNRWETWGEWDGGEYEFSRGTAANAYEGESSAAVECVTQGRGGLFTQPIELDTDTYTLRFMAKSSAKSEIRWGAIYPGGQMLRDDPVGAEWQEFTLTVDDAKSGNWRVYLMSTGQGTVYFDEVRLVGTPKPTEEPDADADLGPAGEPVRFEMRGGHTYLNGEPFFALGMYRAKPEDLQGTAFNVVPGWDAMPTKSLLDECARAGLYALPDLTGLMRGHLPQRAPDVARPFMYHPAVLAWYLCDEPDHERWSVPPDEMRLASKLLRELDPGHLTCSVVMPWADSNLYRYADSVDILMTDIYPIGDERPANLESISRATGVMRRAVKDERPVWVVLQATEKGTPQEHVAATYLAVVAGADGIFYWEYEDGAKNPDVWHKVCALAHELSDLTAPLTSDASPYQATVASDAIRTVTKRAPDGDYLIAVNGMGESVDACKMAFALATDGPATVMFENRTVSVDNGAITDSFAPFERHVYKLPGH